MPSCDVDSSAEQISEIVVALCFAMLCVYTVIIFRQNYDAPPIKKTFWKLLIVFCIFRCAGFATPDCVFETDFRPTQIRLTSIDWHWTLMLLQYFSQAVPDTLLLLIFALFLAFMASVFHLTFRPPLAELGDRSGSEVLESPIVYRNFVRFAGLLITCFLLLAVGHLVLEFVTLSIISLALSGVFSLVLAIGFMIYGNILFETIAPLLHTSPPRPRLPATRSCTVHAATVPRNAHYKYPIRAPKTIVATTASLFHQHSSSRTIDQHASSAVSNKLSAQVTGRGQHPQVMSLGWNPVASSCPTGTIHSPRHVYRSRGNPRGGSTYHGILKTASSSTPTSAAATSSSKTTRRRKLSFRVSDDYAPPSTHFPTRHTRYPSATSLNQHSYPTMFSSASFSRHQARPNFLSSDLTSPSLQALVSEALLGRSTSHSIPNDHYTLILSPKDVGQDKFVTVPSIEPGFDQLRAPKASPESPVVLSHSLNSHGSGGGDSPLLSPDDYLYEEGIGYDEQEPAHTHQTQTLIKPPSTSMTGERPATLVAREQVTNSLSNLLKVASMCTGFLTIRVLITTSEQQTSFPDWWYLFIAAYYIAAEVMGMGFICFVLRKSTHKNSAVVASSPPCL